MSSVAVRYARSRSRGRSRVRREFQGSRSLSGLRVWAPRSRTRGRPIVNTKAVGNIRGHPFPNKLRTGLTILHRNGLISALTATNSVVFRPTSYFDFDPAVGGPSFGGYTQLALIYDRYRVLAFKVVIDWVNLETDGVTVSAEAIADSTTPPTGTATDYTEHAIESANWSRNMTLGPVSANPKGRMKMFVKTTKVWGSPDPATDSAFAANAGSSPAANTFLRLAAYRNNGNNLATGVQFTIKCKSYGYWDEKNDLVA